MSKVTVTCAICGKPYPQAVRRSVAKRHGGYICPACKPGDLSREPYEIVRVSLGALGGWAGVDVGIPSTEELDALERAEEIREALEESPKGDLP